MNIDDLRQHESRVRGALGRDRRLSALDHRVAERMLGYLNWRADSRSFGLAWPSAERLAQEVGAQTRSVRRSLRRLLDLGVLAVAATGGGRRCTTHYRLGPIGLQNSDRPRLKTVTDEVQNSDRPRLKTVTDEVQNSDRARLKTVTDRSPDSKEETEEEGEARARVETIGFDDFELEAEPLTPEPWQSTILEEWWPGPDMAAWAQEHVPSVADPVSLERVEHFKDHRRANGKTQRGDWNAAYRNWLRRQVEIDRRQLAMLLPIPGSAEPRRSDAEAEHAAHLAVFTPTGNWYPQWGPRPDAEGKTG